MFEVAIVVALSWTIVARRGGPVEASSTSPARVAILAAFIAAVASVTAAVLFLAAG